MKLFYNLTIIILLTCQKKSEEVDISQQEHDKTSLETKNLIKRIQNMDSSKQRKYVSYINKNLKSNFVKTYIKDISELSNMDLDKCTLEELQHFNSTLIQNKNTIEKSNEESTQNNTNNTLLKNKHKIEQFKISIKSLFGNINKDDNLKKAILTYINTIYDNSEQILTTPIISLSSIKLENINQVNLHIWEHLLSALKKEKQSFENQQSIDNPNNTLLKNKHKIEQFKISIKSLFGNINKDDNLKKAILTYINTTYDNSEQILIKPITSLSHIKLDNITQENLQTWENLLSILQKEKQSFENQQSIDKIKYDIQDIIIDKLSKMRKEIQDNIVDYINANHVGNDKIFISNITHNKLEAIYRSIFNMYNINKSNFSLASLEHLYNDLSNQYKISQQKQSSESLKYAKILPIFDESTTNQQFDDIYIKNKDLIDKMLKELIECLRMIILDPRQAPPKRPITTLIKTLENIISKKLTYSSFQKFIEAFEISYILGFDNGLRYGFDKKFNFKNIFINYPKSLTPAIKKEIIKYYIKEGGILFQTKKYKEVLWLKSFLNKGKQGPIMKKIIQKGAQGLEFSFMFHLQEFWKKTFSNKSVIIEDSIKKDLKNIFGQQIKISVIAAASVGNTILIKKGNDRFAVKYIKNEVTEETINKDYNNLTTQFPESDSLLKELRDKLLEEINLLKERSNILEGQKVYKSNNPNIRVVDLSKYDNELNSDQKKNFLIMGYVDGKTLGEIIKDISNTKINNPDIKKIGLLVINLYILWLNKLFFTKNPNYHADLHEGNIMISKKDDNFVLTMIDWGNIRKLEDSNVQNILKKEFKIYKDWPSEKNVDQIKKIGNIIYSNLTSLIVSGNKGTSINSFLNNLTDKDGNKLSFFDHNGFHGQFLNAFKKDNIQLNTNYLTAHQSKTILESSIKAYISSARNMEITKYFESSLRKTSLEDIQNLNYLEPLSTK